MATPHMTPEEMLAVLNHRIEENLLWEQNRKLQQNLSLLVELGVLTPEEHAARLAQQVGRSTYQTSLMVDGTECALLYAQEWNRLNGTNMYVTRQEFDRARNLALGL